MHMNQHRSQKGRLFFWYAKTHPHLQYYLKLSDTHRAANQDWLRTAKVVNIRPVDESTRPQAKF
jgi:hypothetical protein